MQCVTVGCGCTGRIDDMTAKSMYVAIRASRQVRALTHTAPGAVGPADQKAVDSG
jgi:hypothetical protein